MTLQGCTNLKLRQFGRQIGRVYDAHLAACGMTAAQYALLSQVVKGGPLRPGELAQALKIEPSTITRNLQPLVAAGWLAVGPGPDARSREVTATEAGRAQRSQAQRAWKQAQLAVNARLGDARVAALHELLDDCAAQFAATEPQTGTV